MPTGLNTTRVNRGVFFKMLWSAFGCLFGSYPTTGFTQEVGIMDFSGVWSVKQGTTAGILMIVCGLIYKIGVLGAALPLVAVAGSGFVSLSILTFMGISIIRHMKWTDKNMMTVGFAICAGMLCLIMPSWFIDSLTGFSRIFFGSAILVCFVFAWLMYVGLSYFGERKESKKSS
jgi:NCS2 family nucleobase:cation symporter-2